MHDFCRDEELFTRHAALLDRLTQLRFCIVHFCAIEMLVADFDGCLETLDQIAIDGTGAVFLKPGSACPVADLSSSSSV